MPRIQTAGHILTPTLRSLDKYWTAREGKTEI